MTNYLSEEMGFLTVFLVVIIADRISALDGVIKKDVTYLYQIKANELLHINMPFLNVKNTSTNFGVIYDGELLLNSKSNLPIDIQESYEAVLKFSYLKVSIVSLENQDISSDKKKILHEFSFENAVKFYNISKNNFSSIGKSSSVVLDSIFDNLITMLIFNRWSESKNRKNKFQRCNSKTDKTASGRTIVQLSCNGEKTLWNKIFQKLSSFIMPDEFHKEFNFQPTDFFDENLTYTRVLNSEKLISEMSGLKTVRNKMHTFTSAISMKVMNHTQGMKISDFSTMSNNGVLSKEEALKLESTRRDRDLEISKDLNAQFSRINFETSAFNFMSLKQLLSQLHTFEHLNTSILSPKSKKVFLSALAEIGTDSSIQYLCDVIKDNKLDDLTTLQFYRNLQKVNNPGEKALDSIATLVKVKTPGIGGFFEKFKRPGFLKQQLFLGASYVANAYCKKKDLSSCEYLAARDSIVNHIAENVNFDVHEDNLRFALLALGNINVLTPLAINEIQSVLSDDKTPNTLKIIALQTVSSSASPILREAARKILEDGTYPEDIRIHAYLAIFETHEFKPEDIKVISEIFEKNDTRLSYFITTHVNGIRNSALASLKSSNPQITEIHVPSTNSFEPESLAQRMSHFMELSDFDETLELGVSLAVTVTFIPGCKQPIYVMAKLILEISGVQYGPIEIRLNQRFFLNPESFYAESEPTDWLSLFKSLSSKFTYIRLFNQTVVCDLPSMVSFKKGTFFNMQTTKFGFLKSRFSLIDLVESYTLLDLSTSVPSLAGIPLVWHLNSAVVSSTKADAEGSPLATGLGFLMSKTTHLSGEANISSQFSFALNGRVSLGDELSVPFVVGHEVQMRFENIFNIGMEDFLFGKRKGRFVNLAANFSFPFEKLAETSFSFDSYPIWSNKSIGMMPEMQQKEYCHEMSEACYIRKGSVTEEIVRHSSGVQIKNPWDKGMFVNVTLTKRTSLSAFVSFFNKTLTDYGDNVNEENLSAVLKVSSNKNWFNLVLNDASAKEKPVMSIKVFQDDSYSHVGGKFGGPLKNIYLNSSKTEVIHSFPAFSEWQCSDKISLNQEVSVELQHESLGQYHNQTFLYTDFEGNTHVKEKTKETSQNTIKSWTLNIQNGKRRTSFKFSKKRIYCDENTVKICNFWSNSSRNGEIRDYSLTVAVDCGQNQIQPGSQVATVEHRISYREEADAAVKFRGLELSTPYLPQKLRLTLEYFWKGTLGRYSHVVWYYGVPHRTMWISSYSYDNNGNPRMGEFNGSLEGYANFNGSYNIVDQPLMLNLSYSSLSGNLKGAMKILADKAVLSEESSFSWRNCTTGEYTNGSKTMSVDFYKGRVDKQSTKYFKKGAAIIDSNAYNTHRNAGWGFFFLGLFGFITVVLLLLNASRRVVTTGRCKYSFSFK